MPGSRSFARRSFLAGVGALAVTSLAACSSDGKGGASSSGSGTAASLLPKAEGTTTYPLELTSALGTSKLTKRPERVATIDSLTDSEYVALLGVTPVLVPSDIADDVWMKNAFPKKVEGTFDSSGETLPFEKIAAAKPDVIIATDPWLKKEVYTKLTAIAPVVGPKSAKPAGGTGTKDAVTAIAEALDLKAAGAAALKKHDDVLAKVRTEHPEFGGKTISYAVYHGDQGGLLFNNASDSIAESIFTAMGFAKNPRAGQFASDGTVSNEKLSTLDADVMLLSDNSGIDTNGKSTLTKITGLALFKNLGVVKKGRVVELTNTGKAFVVDGKTHPGNVAASMAYGGPLAQEWAATTLAPYLSEALKK